MKTRLCAGLFATLPPVIFLMSCGQSTEQPQTSSSDRVKARDSAEVPGLMAPVPGLDISADGQSVMWPRPDVMAAQWEEAQRWILARPGGTNRDRLLGGSIAALAEADPERAAHALTEWRHAIPSAWAGAAKAVVAALWKKNPAAALEFLSTQVPAAQQGDLWPALLGPLPPKKAAEWLGTTNLNTAKLGAAATILVNWTIRDPEAAAAWLDKLGASLSSAQMRLVASPRHFVMNFDIGAPKFDNMEANRRAFEAARHPAARRIFADNYLRAVGSKQPAQLAEITADVEKKLAATDAAELRLETAKAQLAKDPAGYVAALTPDELQQLPDHFVREIRNAWAQIDTPAATRWALERNDPDGVASGVSSWYGMDRAAVLQFVTDMPPGAARDKSMLELCGRLSWDQDFDGAEKCRAAITDPEMVNSAGYRLKRGRERYPASK